MAEGWKLGGLLRGCGIPSPSGHYRVGCVDLMLNLAGDQQEGGLLVRLHYPTSASPATGADGGYHYAPWYPRKEYIRGYLDYKKTKFLGLVSSAVSTVIGMLLMDVNGLHIHPNSWTFEMI